MPKTTKIPHEGPRPSPIGGQTRIHRPQRASPLRVRNGSGSKPGHGWFASSPVAGESRNGNHAHAPLRVFHSFDSVHTDPVYRFTLIFAVLLTSGVFTSLAARADDDRFTLRLGAIQVEGNAHIDASGNSAGSAYSYSSERLDFGKQTVPRVDGTFRLSKRNRLLFNYFTYRNGNRYILEDDFPVDAELLPAGTAARIRAAFDLELPSGCSCSDLAAED